MKTYYINTPTNSMHVDLGKIKAISDIHDCSPWTTGHRGGSMFTVYMDQGDPIHFRIWQPPEETSAAAHQMHIHKVAHQQLVDAWKQHIEPDNPQVNVIPVITVTVSGARGSGKSAILQTVKQSLEAYGIACAASTHDTGSALHRSEDKRDAIITAVRDRGTIVMLEEVTTARSPGTT